MRNGSVARAAAVTEPVRTGRMEDGLNRPFWQRKTLVCTKLQ
jgi:hypothetical protein